MRRLAVLVGTGLGTGFFPVAPGTVGSLLGVALYLPAAGNIPLFFLLLAAVTAAGTWAAGICGRLFGEHDSRRIVVDEIGGMMVTLFSFPAEPLWLILGFFIFRFFDIFKPPPIGAVDRKWASAGGVMADDLLAGIYANLTLQVVRLFFQVII
jgi:phosphatidylglycerophosphatase A